MNGAFYIGATGLRAQQRALDLVANNIANLNTPGFKRSVARFSEVFAPGADGAAVDGGVAVDLSRREFAQGELKTTGKPMDLAIDGTGFVELAGRDGQILLWRGGVLGVNAEGQLAGPEGLPLRAMIAVPLDAKVIKVSADGVVSAAPDEIAPAVEIGRIELATVKDLGALTPVGQGLFRPSAESDVMALNADDDSAGRFVQGALEGSNVQMAEEMVTLLLMQRVYAANAQVLQAGDQLMSIANGLRR